VSKVNNKRTIGKPFKNQNLNACTLPPEGLRGNRDPSPNY